MKHIILLFFIFCYTGCGPFDEDYVEYDASPHEVYLLSVSESRPAEVTIGWMYYASDGCRSAKGGTAERDGQTLYLTITGITSTGPGDCTNAVEVRHGEITVKNLEAGEYTINGKDDNTETEIGRFRIEPDMAYSFTALPRPVFFTDPIAPNTDIQKGDTYQVKVRLYLEGFYKISCEPIFKTDVDRREPDVIRIAASEVIPKKHCQIILDPFKATDQHEHKHSDIALGTFPKGLYTVMLNGIAYPFEVPQPLY